jgi:membrane associated rhomboid family serine protease
MSTPETPATGASPQEAPVCYRHTDREAHIRCQRCDRPICPYCMQPASVGFQCPSCVREGSRGTRTARTPYGGERTGNPALTSRVLVAINVVVWVLILATGWQSSQLIGRLALTPAGFLRFVNGVPQFIPGVADGAPWQLLTSMFTHVEIWHIGFNMLVLWTLGPQLELAVGRLRFLVIYLVSGLAASATVMWLAPEHVSTLGASGAIFGMLGTLLVIAIKVGGDVRGIATWIGINFVLTFLLANVSWQGHIGGFVGGLLVGAAIVYAPRRRRATWQAVGVGAVSVLVALATIVRIAALS